MISTRKKGTTNSHIAKIHQNQPSQSAVGFIRLLGDGKGRIAKLVSSTTELWVPLQDLSSLVPHNAYTPDSRKYSLHYYTVPQAIPSNSVLFKVCIEE
jgi:hypothetical protein